MLTQLLGRLQFISLVLIYSLFYVSHKRKKLVCWGIAQWVKYLRHKPNDLSLNPQHPCKMPCIQGSCMVGGERKILKHCLVNQSNQICYL